MVTLSPQVIGRAKHSLPEGMCRPPSLWQPPHLMAATTSYGSSMARPCLMAATTSYGSSLAATASYGSRMAKLTAYSRCSRDRIFSIYGRAFCCSITCFDRIFSIYGRAFCYSILTSIRSSLFMVATVTALSAALAISSHIDAAHFTSVFDGWK